MSENLHFDVAVLGGGPGGYTAAFRAADLGKKVVLIEKNERIGGVCLNIGCIPSKTLLHAAEIIEEATESESYGIHFEKLKINLNTLRKKKEDVVTKLTDGLKRLARARAVTILRGTGSFSDTHSIRVSGADGDFLVGFEKAIIAVGSRPLVPGFLPNEDNRVWDSTAALSLPFVPRRLAVLGGGIIGLEMAQVYAALGSEITIIEMMDQIIPPADPDLVRPLAAKMKKKYNAVYTGTKLTAVKTTKEVLVISLEGEKNPETIEAEALLVSVGRIPNTENIGMEDVGIQINTQGFLSVDEYQETSVPGIFAIGDVVGNPMLAHKAVYEGKVAAEVISGLKSANSAITIPSVAYTNPEIAWTGVTEKQAQSEGITYNLGVFPWVASGRALSADKAYGKTKALFDQKTGRIIGAGITGARAGDLIAEATLAIEMGADAVDIGHTIHAHPTFAETFAFSAEMKEGTITDVMPLKKK